MITRNSWHAHKSDRHFADHVVSLDYISSEVLFPMVQNDYTET